MLLSEMLALFVSGLVFVRALLVWKRGMQPKTMVGEAALATLGMMFIATGHWTIGVVFTGAALLLEVVMLFALIRWKRNQFDKDS